MKVMVLNKDKSYQIVDIKGYIDIEVASWEYIGDFISSCVFNKDKTLRCFYNDAFGYDITDREELNKYKNTIASSLFDSNLYNTVVICGYRNGKNCPIRKRDIKMIEEIINGKETV